MRKGIILAAQSHIQVSFESLVREMTQSDLEQTLNRAKRTDSARG